MTRRKAPWWALPCLLLPLVLAGCSGPATNGAQTPAAANQALTPDDATGELPPEPEPSSTEHFKLGTNYIRLSPTQPTSSSPTRIEVAEVFAYGNPLCSALESELETWVAAAPVYVHFVRIPAVWTPAMRLQARGFYTAQALDKLPAMNAAFFSAAAASTNPLDSKAALAALFSQFGVDTQTFDTTFDSPAVLEKLERADALNRRYRVTSLPSLIVNGKYVTNATMAGGTNQMLALVNELVAAEKAATER